MTPLPGGTAEVGTLLIVLLVWALGAYWLLRHLGYLAPLGPPRLPIVRTKELLIAIAGFFAFPLIASFLFLLFSWDAFAPGIDLYVTLNFLAVTSITALVIVSVYTLHRHALFSIFSTRHGIAKSLLRGTLLWLLAFPIVQLVEYAVMLLLLALGHVPTEEQVAVAGLRHALGHPWAQSLAFLQVVAIVPPLEELLFRGLFQTWLLHHCSRKKAILISSLAFALLHFSWQQGITNVLLLPPLFLLGAFLGWSFERFGTLWVPIGLHATFNAIGAIVIFFP